MRLAVLGGEGGGAVGTITHCSQRVVWCEGPRIWEGLGSQGGRLIRVKFLKFLSVSSLNLEKPSHLGKVSSSGLGDWEKHFSTWCFLLAFTLPEPDQ